MMIAASIIAPMAMAMPPRLMMFEPRPINRMATNARRMDRGSVTMATRALRKCHRNTMQTSETMTISSRSLPFSVSMERSIKPERS